VTACAAKVLQVRGTSVFVKKRRGKDSFSFFSFFFPTGVGELIDEMLLRENERAVGSAHHGCVQQRANQRGKKEKFFFCRCVLKEWHSWLDGEAERCGESHT
jgi:hypothetical protein